MNRHTHAQVVIRPDDTSLRTIFVAVPKGAVWGMAADCLPVRTEAEHGVLRLCPEGLGMPIRDSEGLFFFSVHSTTQQHTTTRCTNYTEANNRTLNKHARLAITMRFGSLPDTEVKKMRAWKHEQLGLKTKRNLTAVAADTTKNDLHTPRGVAVGKKVPGNYGEFTEMHETLHLLAWNVGGEKHVLKKGMWFASANGTALKVLGVRILSILIYALSSGIPFCGLSLTHAHAINVGWVAQKQT